MPNGFLKTLVLALPQIYTPVFHAWKSKNWTVLGIKILAHVISLLFRASSRVWRCTTLPFSVSGS